MGQLYSHLVFRPPMPSYECSDGRMSYVVRDAKGEPRVESSRLIWLKTALGAIIPASWVNFHLVAASKHVVLFAHSNGDDLGAAMVEAHRLSAALDVAVFAFDYTGYGISELPSPSSRFRPAATKKNIKKNMKKRGLNTQRTNSSSCYCNNIVPSLLEEDRRRATPSEFACYADIHAAYTYLVRDVAVEPSNIILVGRSIGSGPVVHCAARNACGGVVLVAPIASAVRVALQRVNVTVPFLDTFANIDKVSRIRCPVLVVHGDDDQLVPIRHAKLLLRKATTAVEPLFIPRAAHNNVVEDNQSLVFKRCRGFLREVQDATNKRSESNINNHRKIPITIRSSHDIGVGLLHYANSFKHQIHLQAARKSAAASAKLSSSSSPAATRNRNSIDRNANTGDLPPATTTTTSNTTTTAPTTTTTPPLPTFPRRCFPLKRRRTRNTDASLLPLPSLSKITPPNEALPAHLSTYAKLTQSVSETVANLGAATVSVSVSVKKNKKDDHPVSPVSPVSEVSAVSGVCETISDTVPTVPLSKQERAAIERLSPRTMSGSAVFAHVDEYDDTVYRQQADCDLLYPLDAANEDMTRSILEVISKKKKKEDLENDMGGSASLVVPPSRRATLPPLTRQVMDGWM